MNTRNKQKKKDNEDNINVLSQKRDRKGNVIKEDKKEDKKEEDKKNGENKEEDKKDEIFKDEEDSYGINYDKYDYYRGDEPKKDSSEKKVIVFAH